MGEVGYHKMMNKQEIHQSYAPPSAARIKAHQDEIGALRLLIAQRKLYSRSKRWLALRLIIGLIGIFAPIVALVWPNLSVAMGALAGVWIFLSKTTFLKMERQLAARAAAIQELFDIEVFEMPELAARSPMPTPEEVAKLAGPDEKIIAVAKKERLLEWYAVNDGDSGVTAVAICQRTNAAYSADLLKTSARLWLTLVCIWAITLVIMSLSLGFNLNTFLMGVTLPLLPAFLDAATYWQGIKRASSEREAISEEIKDKLAHNNLTGEDLIIWQTAMYDLRRNVPQVLNFVYKIMRPDNEWSMKSVARQLSELAKKVEGDGQS